MKKLHIYISNFVFFYLILLRAISYSIPNPPAGLVSEPLENEIRLTWQAPTEQTDGSPITYKLGYVVYRSTSSDGPFEEIATVEEDTTYLDVSIKDKGFHPECLHK